MGLLDLFRAPDPTADWPPAQPRPLTLDFVNGDLEGLRMGMPWTELVRFGRPANRQPAPEMHLVYPGLGVYFQVHDGRVVDAVFELRDTDIFGSTAECARHGAFTPPCLRIVQPDGGVMEPTAATTPEEVRRRFGEPSYVDGQPAGDDGEPVTLEDDDGSVFKPANYLGLGYTRSSWQVEFEFGPGPQRTLYSVSMGAVD